MSTTWILKLYPRTWRERYEEEMHAVLEEHRGTLATFIDLLLGAVDAHLDPEAWRPQMSFSPERLQRLRTASTTPFWLFPLFFFLWFIISRGDDSWQYLKEINPIASTVYGILYAGQNLGSELSIGFLAIFAVQLFTAVLLAINALRNSSRDLRRETFQLLPLLALALIALAALIRGKFIWLGTVLAVPIVLPPLIAFVISKSSLSEPTTRLVLIPSILASLTMVATLLGILVLQSIAVVILGTPAWPLQLVPGFIGICLIVSLTLRALWRAFKAVTAASPPPTIG